MNVLIIEPNKVLAVTYIKALTESGCKVDCRGGAQTAIHAIDTNRPDVVVLEPQLAKHSGIEFLYELRSYSDLQDLPIVIHSFVPRSAFVGQLNILDQLGVTQYLYKPQTSLIQLVSCIKGVIQPAAT